MSFSSRFASFLLGAPSAKHVFLDDAPEPYDHEEEDARALAPMATPVHILTQDGLVRVRDGKFRYEPKEGDPVERPIELVSAVHIYGWGGITSPAVAALTQTGAPVVWRSASGYPIALAGALSPPGLATRKAQYRAADNEMASLSIARAIVRAKIISMRGVVRRRRKDLKSDLARLRRFANTVDSAKSLNVLRGIEGAATACYFNTWPELLRGRAEPGCFAGRSRRPPRDLANAILSYCYSVLLGEALCACAAAGLDPRQGFLHATRDGRHALPLDLMEPYRPIVADVAVLTALNVGEVTEGDVETTEQGAQLTEVGKRSTLAALERRLAAASADDPKLATHGSSSDLAMKVPSEAPADTEASPPPRRPSWRARMSLDAERLAKALRDEVAFAPAVRA